jgi:hypothetical protein
MKEVMLDARMNPTMHGVWYADDEVQHASRSSIIMVRDGACSFIYLCIFVRSGASTSLTLRHRDTRFIFVQSVTTFLHYLLDYS